MELIVTFFLLGLLTIAVCNLFDAKAKTIAIITTIVLVGYFVVIFLTCDLRAVFAAFITWLEAVGHQLAEKWSA